MQQYKVLFLGPAASGKTQAVKTLCGDEAVYTEVKSNEYFSENKHETTVALDYGVLPFGQYEKLHIYGAPGQDRFNFMWDILLKGCLGAIILINAQIYKSEEAILIIENYRKYLNNIEYLVGLTHVDLMKQTEINTYMESIQRYVLNENNVKLANPRIRKDVASLVKNLIIKVRERGE